MKLTNKNIVNLGYAATLALAGLTGCGTDGSYMQDFFPADDSMRRSRQFVSEQATTGAREDLTLQAMHFDGSKLNSLGTQKLTRVVPDSPDDDVIVYLDLPKDDMSAARHDEVMTYLKTVGVADAHIKLHDGPNLNLTTLSADGLSRMAKVEAGDLTGGSSSGAASGAAAAGGGSGSSAPSSMTQ